MLQNLETFARLHAPFYGKEGLNRQWAEKTDAYLTNFSDNNAMYIGMEFWGESRNNGKEGWRANLFYIAAMCQDAMKCTTSPHVLKVLQTAFSWGCEQTEELRQQVADLKKTAQKGWAESPQPCYMGHTQKAVILATGVCALAEALKPGYQPDARIRLEYAALFLNYQEMEAEFRHFKDMLGRGELVYCRDGIVAWNSAYKRKWFRSELSLRDHEVRVLSEMLDFGIMLLRLPTYPEVSGKVAA